MKKLLFILILFCSLQGFGQIKAYWRLDGNSNDASGNGNNGTDTNITYSQANGKLNQGAGFNGTSSKIVVNHNSSLSITTNVTISLWLNFSTWSSSGDYGFIFKGTDPFNYSLSFSSYSGGRFNFSTAGTNNFSTATVAFNTNVWYNVVVVYSNTSLSFYVNSKKIGNSITIVNLATNTATLRIGSYITGAAQSQWFPGSIDEVIIDNSAWSPAKVKNEYIRMLGAFSN